MVKEAANEIDHDAAAWMARLDRGLTQAEEDQLQAWLDSDPRHLGAFARVKALSMYTQRSAGLGPGYRPELFREAEPPAHLNRRRFLTLAAGTLGTAAAASGWFLFFHSATRYSTRTGEVRSIALADGSVLTLNTGSSAAVRFSRGRRDVELLGGEAIFEVAKDAARPFFVSANALQIRVVGTLFGVKLVANQPAQVLVQEGIVEAHKNAALAEPVRLTANMRGVVTAAAPLAASTVTSEEVLRQLAWREGRIIFEGESLAEASAEFARYSDTRIVIDDPGLAREEVSGSYQANDPVGFGRAMAEALRARVVVADGEVRLLR